MGLALQVQLVDAIPVNELDFPMDEVIVPKGRYLRETSPSTAAAGNLMVPPPAQGPDHGGG